MGLGELCDDLHVFLVVAVVVVWDLIVLLLLFVRSVVLTVDDLVRTFLSVIVFNDIELPLLQLSCSLFFFCNGRVEC